MIDKRVAGKKNEAGSRMLKRLPASFNGGRRGDKIPLQIAKGATDRLIDPGVFYLHREARRGRAQPSVTVLRLTRQKRISAGMSGSGRPWGKPPIPHEHAAMRDNFAKFIGGFGRWGRISLVCRADRCGGNPSHETL